MPAHSAIVSALAAACVLAAACGENTVHRPAAAAQPPVAAQAPEETGAAIWKKACAPCHDGGLGDGPAIGDRDAWQPRVAQGTPVLLQHALEGFTGKKGEMPPRGGDDSLSDAQIELALSYMIAKSR